MNIVCSAMLILILFVMAGPAGADMAGKKLIEYGQGFPDTKFYKEHVRKMEKVGFDGFVIRVAGPGDEWSLGYKVFTRTRIDPTAVEGPIADLKTVHSDVLTDNFVQVAGAVPADVDWFDPDWSAACHNAALMARVAKQGGLKGLMIDPEEYGERHPWTYRTLPHTHTFEEYRDKVRARGREFMRAINAEYPDITILFLLGPSFGHKAHPAGKPEESSYTLLPAFIDGMCEAATPGTVIVDGYEQSYPFRRLSFFQKARAEILEKCRELSLCPTEYAEHVRVGFGVWVDYDRVRVGWHPDDFNKNYYTPAEFRNSLSYALETSDRYVWVWSEGPRWWEPNGIPNPYKEALKLAKRGPTPVPDRNFPYPPNPPDAAKMPGYSDEETFSKFLKTMSEVMDFPKDGWRFVRDPDSRGEAARYYAVEFDDSAWRTISIGKFWQQQGEYFNGDAWYRRTVDIPVLCAGRKVYVAVGAADEGAVLYVNGQYAGKHDIGPIGWTIPFSIEVTDLIKPGKPNLFAFRVIDTSGLGGLWKSIKLMTARTGPSK